jgi:hypothetical protein
MANFVPHCVVPRAPGRRITGSAFRLGGLALAVAPRREAGAGIPRQRSGRAVGEDRRPDPL